MIALSVMWISSGHTSVQHLVMLHRPMPSSSLSTRARDFEFSGCISRAATRTKYRGPPNSSIFSCSRRTWHTFWQRKHSIHLRNSCTRSRSRGYIFHSARGGARTAESSVSPDSSRKLRDQVFDYGERFQRIDRDGLVQGKGIHAGLAGEPGGH